MSITIIKVGGLRGLDLRKTFKISELSNDQTSAWKRFVKKMKFSSSTHLRLIHYDICNDCFYYSVRTNNGAYITTDSDRRVIDFVNYMLDHKEDISL